MKRVLILVLAITMVLLCSCSKPADETLPATVPTQETTNPPTDPPTNPPTDAPTDPTEEPTDAPTEPPVLYRNPLTGEPLDALTTDRPVCVVFNNNNGLSIKFKFIKISINGPSAPMMIL